MPELLKKKGLPRYLHKFKDPEFIDKIKKHASQLGLYVGLIVYTAVGAKIFQVIEYPYELDNLKTFQSLLITKREVFLRSLWNESHNSVNYRERVDELLVDYEAVVEEAVSNGINAVTQDYEISWNYIQSVFFSTTILTTIGYGNIAPKTFGGRLFCIFFAILGMPLTISVLGDIGGMFATLVTMVWSKNKDTIMPILYKCKILKEKSESNEGKPAKHKEKEANGLLDLMSDIDDAGMGGNMYTAVFALLFLCLFLSFGAFVFTLWENWTFFDAFYFCFITMTTIGFGDIVPDIVGEKTTYMLVCTIYILVGLAFTSTIIELVRRQYAESWRKMQELRAQIQAQLKLAETLKKLSDNAAANGVELDADMAGDLAQLRGNLAKFKNSKLGKGLDDIDIDELDWVDKDKRVKAVTIFIYETSL